MELYECDPDSVDEMLQYFRISSNAIYQFRLRTEDKICCLRLSPAEEKEPSDVESKIYLIDWLIERGFPVMRPVPMKDGKLFGQISTEWGTSANLHLKDTAILIREEARSSIGSKKSRAFAPSIMP